MKKNREIWIAISLISQLGVSMLAPIFLCVIFGNIIEKHINIPATIILLFLGIAAGFRNCWLLIVNTQGLRKDGTGEKFKLREFFGNRSRRNGDGTGK